MPPHQLPNSYRVTSSTEGLDPSAGKAIRAQFQRACAIAHGVGKNMSANQLMQLVMEKGLPPLEEREAILAARLGDNIADSDVPAGVDQDEDSQPDQG